MSNNTIIVAIIAIVAIGFLAFEFGQVSDLTGDVSHITACTDTDKGLDYYTAGTVTDGTVTFNDVCVGGYLTEFYCIDTNTVSSQGFACPGGPGSCLTTKGVGSRCVSAPAPTYTSPPSIITPPTCTDSDGGLDYFTAGTVSDGTRTFDDTCYGTTLIEFYCSGNNPTRQKFLCPGSCLTTKGVGSRCL